MRRDPRQLPDLSPAEWDVMTVIWKHGPVAARDVYSHLSEDRTWSYATVKTLLRRIVKKGWVDYDQIGNSYLYRAAVRREKAVFAAIGEFSNRVLDGVLAPFVAYFAKQNDLTPEDLDELEQVLKRHRRKEDTNHDGQ